MERRAGIKLIKNASRAKLLLIGLLCSLPTCNAVCLGMAAGVAPKVAVGYMKSHAAQKKSDATVFAALQVDLEHACDGGEFLVTGLRDYQKRPFCAKCDAGTTFISDGKGGGVETCSACGSGDMVIKLNHDDRKEFCDLLAKVKDAETERGLSGSDEITAALSREEINYNCRAGDQDACKTADSLQTAEELAQIKAQTEAMQSQAAALRSQASALQQANQQRWEASQGMPVLP